jgi:hypothetical protein
VVGVLLGPTWLDMVPYADSLALLGRLGLYAMVVESSSAWRVFFLFCSFILIFSLSCFFW